MRDFDARLVRKILLGQALLSLVLATMLLALGPVYAGSGLLGGGVALVASAIFALAVFRPYRAQWAGRLVAQFYGAELMKLLVIAAAFYGIFQWVRPLSAASLFGCFVAVHLVPAVVAARN